jgi:hypothetical protein
MFVRVIDHRGKEHWVNPLFVRHIVPKGADRCELYGMFGSFGTPIRARSSAAEMAKELSAAMPDSPAWQAAASEHSSDLERRRRAAGQSASIT